MRRKGAILRIPMLVAMSSVALLSSSCAVVFSGTTQSVPVSSEPARAEVYVDVTLEGFTPLVLELGRGRNYRVVVRLGAQQRAVVLRSGTHTVPLVLDLVPVAVSGGFVVALAATGAFEYTLSGYEPIALGLVATTFTPLLVDYGTGALYQLTPGEVVVTFDGR